MANTQSKTGGRTSRRVQRLVRLLEEMDLETQGSNDKSERALWHLLMQWRERLPELDGYFHKAFRQCDVTDDGHTDMAIWNLLHSSKIFWKLFEKAQAEKPNSESNHSR